MSSALMWAIHNIIGHPLMEVFRILGMRRLGDWIHDVTIPAEAPDFKAVCSETAQYENTGINYSWFGRKVIDAVDSGMFDELSVYCLSNHSAWGQPCGSVRVTLLMSEDFSFGLIVNESGALCYSITDLDLEEALTLLDVVVSIKDLAPRNLSALGFMIH